MSNILEVFVYSAVIIAFFVLVGLVLYLSVRNRMLRKDVAQGLIDHFAIMQKLEEANKNTDAKKIEETEGFLKFVSQSRDWAFQYIESVQLTIKKFQDVFHPIAVQYYKDKEQPINQEEFGKLFEAYKKLVEELPDEGKR